MIVANYKLENVQETLPFIGCTSLMLVIQRMQFLWHLRAFRNFHHLISPLINMRLLIESSVPRLVDLPQVSPIPLHIVGGPFGFFARSTAAAAERTRKNPTKNATSRSDHWFFLSCPLSASICQKYTSLLFPSCSVSDLVNYCRHLPSDFGRLIRIRINSSDW